MPYIQSESRPKYDVFINRLLETIPTDADEITIVEYTAYSISQIMGKFLGVYDISSNDDLFNCRLFEGQRRDAIFTISERIASEVGASRNMLQQAGDLNYIISFLTWGVLGDAPNRTRAGYGMRAFMKGCLQEVIASLKPYYGYNRYFVMARAVLTDVIDETYRRRTAPYEDEKIEQNGDLWT